MPEFVIPYKPRPWQRDLHNGLRSHRWAVTVAHRRAGKTVGLVNHLLACAAECKLREPFFAYVAPQYNQAKSIAWGYVKYFTSRIPGVKTNESELWAMLPHNNAKIRLFGMDNPDALRGLYFDGIVLDEYADMHPEAWEAVIRPALSDRKGWACLSGTPRGHNAFYEAYLAALDSDKWFVGMYRADETDVIDSGELAALKEEMTDAKFRQEYLCDFDVADEDVLIGLDLVMDAMKRDTPVDNFQPVVVGVDVARFGDDQSIIRGRQGRDARSFPVERFAKIDTMTLASRAVDYCRRVGAELAFVDGGGVGGGVVDRMIQLGFNAIEVNFGGKASNANLYARKDVEMWATMKEWLKGGVLERENNTLVAQLTSRRYKFDVNGKLVLEPKSEMKERGLSSPDEADALALTFAEPVHAYNYAEQTAMFFRGSDYQRTRDDYDPLGAM